MIIKTSYSFMKPPPSARLIRGHRLAQGLVGYWPFNEGSGNIVSDLSGNGNKGAFSGDVSWTAGKFGSALNFPGTDDYIDLGLDASIKPTGAMTIIGVIKGESVSTTSGSIIGTQGGSGVRGFYLGPSNTGRIVCQIAADSTTNYSLGVDGIHSSSVWTSYTMVYSPSTYLRLYQNAVLVGERTDSVPASQYQANGTSVKIGNRGDLAGDFLGLIDYILIYNRALSASEIVELYREPFGMFERKARTALMSGYEVVAPPVGMAGAMTTNSGYWGW